MRSDPVEARAGTTKVDENAPVASVVNDGIPTDDALNHIWPDEEAGRPAPIALIVSPTLPIAGTITSVGTVAALADVARRLVVRARTTTIESRFNWHHRGTP